MSISGAAISEYALGEETIIVGVVAGVAVGTCVVVSTITARAQVPWVNGGGGGFRFTATYPNSDNRGFASKIEFSGSALGKCQTQVSVVVGVSLPQETPSVQKVPKKLVSVSASCKTAANTSVVSVFGRAAVNAHLQVLRVESKLKLGANYYEEEIDILALLAMLD